MKNWIKQILLKNQNFNQRKLGLISTSLLKQSNTILKIEPKQAIKT